MSLKISWVFYRRSIGTVDYTIRRSVVYEYVCWVCTPTNVAPLRRGRVRQRQGEGGEGKGPKAPLTGGARVVTLASTHPDYACARVCAT